jgi:hypothetical protein
MPREHGAYVELGFPLVTALGLGRLNFAQLLLAIATVAVFLAHEPILVLAGERGRRALGHFKRQAASLAIVLLVVAIGTGAVGWWNAPPIARATLVLPLIFAALLIPLILSHREKTLAGELLVAFTFSSALIPIAMAGDVAPRIAVTAGAVWAGIFLLETLTVRGVRASRKEIITAERSFLASLVGGVMGILAAIVITMAGALPLLAGVAIVPAALVALTCALARVHARQLRTLGWSLAASNVVALAALLSVFR